MIIEDIDRGNGGKNDENEGIEIGKGGKRVCVLREGTSGRDGDGRTMEPGRPGARARAEPKPEPEPEPETGARSPEPRVPV